MLNFAIELFCSRYNVETSPTC